MWSNFPLNAHTIKQVQYPTLLTILNHLEKSNKIMYDKKDSILGIFEDNPKIKKLHRESTLR